MKESIHPQYYPEARVRCACGHTFTIGSTLPQMEVEICSNCHPFYTGAKKLVDTAGRVEKFRARLKKTEEIRKKKTVVRKEKTVKKTENRKPISDF